MTDRMKPWPPEQSGHPLAAQALARFHKLFQHDALVLDKWFALQGGACDRGGNVLPAVKQLMKHPDFQIKTPPRAQPGLQLLQRQSRRLPPRQATCSGASVIELDAINPRSPPAGACLDRWSKLAEPYARLREAIAAGGSRRTQQRRA